MGLVREYKRPWKLATLAIGTGLLLIGAVTLNFPDWDIPISLIMPFFTYLTASWVLHVFVERRWACVPLAVFFVWFSVDGCYYLYWVNVKPEALVMRSAQWPLSLWLYFACAAVWYYEGDFVDLRALLKEKFSAEYTGVY